MEYFDLHCDTVNKCYEKAVPFKDTAFMSCVGEMLKQKQCFALFVSDSFDEDEARIIRARLFEKYSEMKNSAEMEGVMPLLTLENSKGIRDIPLWRSRGAVMASLTWNGENEFACGSSCETGGLKAKGKELIRAYEKENIVLDVSHLNFQSFYDICRFTDIPLVASHSNCYSVCEHRRNLKDGQLKEIIKRGGLIGLCFYPLFLGGDAFENIYRNICCILTLGGESCISLGSDFDGARMSEKLKNSRDVMNLYEFLRTKSLSEKLLAKIFYKNAENFFINVLH